ncbi:MAG TPA: TonB-dependent receptor plug domain-containing protein, partial [Chitinophagaceae bacterium]|nr:TonB-dependent receptor plug domain-containing protein [Chitinophagaceae bacterium]
VVVTAFGTKSKKDLSYSISRVQAKELLNPVEQALQGKIAGLNIVGTANARDASTINLRGSRTVSGGNNPLIVVDGVPVHHSTLNAFNPGDIESVTVLKDAAAIVIYGYLAANGVIMIETKKFRNEKIRFNFSNPYYYASKSIRVSGTIYSVARRFYAPKYTSLQPDERNDFRETIYWNPVVQTGKDGKAELEYFNSDATTTFRVITEGIGYNGLAGRSETTYTTRNAMSIDAKIPPYLTVGDQALVPLVIKNNSIQQLVLEIDMVVPKGIRTGAFDRTLVLEPDSSRQLLVPIEALTGIKDKIQFIIKGSHEKETLTLPLVATEKGFPVNLSFSGSQTARHDFTIDKAIPGTLKASLKLYKSLEGQLLDGIESMLREPHGCFEQTSSCTYPNIYVLKYLRESGKSNPVIEKKAMEYIEKGYERLVGYETKQDGFEWFGNTPPHEALTAYGLLEFTDMQEFIDVDKQMMARTKKFLLSRRDGQGSFHLASGGYDRFASVPGKIAHIYIVYALTQAGIGKEIVLEYQAALKKAIESNDGYQMAMMALAASNMKQEKDYEKLMGLLHSNYLKSGLSSETSVVNSRDVSLRVETQALYALALMRKSSPDLEMIGRLITSILAEKTYYGYGATQATVLALQAIVHYSKLIGSLNDTDMDFTMNDKPAGDYQDITGGLREGRNKIGIHYATEKNNIPYSFELSYSTLTPLNSDKSILRLSTGIKEQVTAVGETVRMEIAVHNVQSQMQPMAVAKIGIPAGLAVQPWQLKEIMEKKQVAYYEIFDNYLVLYWMGFAQNETKKI